MLERLLGRAAHASAAPGAAAPGDADAVRDALRLLAAAAVTGIANAPSKEEDLELVAVACCAVGACGALLRLAPATRPAAAGHAGTAAALDLALRVMHLAKPLSDLDLQSGRRPPLERFRIALGAAKAALCSASRALRALLALPPAASLALMEPSVFEMAEFVVALVTFYPHEADKFDWYERWVPGWCAAAGAVLSLVSTAVRHPLWAGAWAEASQAPGAQETLCRLAWRHAVEFRSAIVAHTARREHFEEIGTHAALREQAEAPHIARRLACGARGRARDGVRGRREELV